MAISQADRMAVRQFHLVLELGVSGCVQQAEKDPACSWAGRVVILWVGAVTFGRIGIVAGGEVQD